jgi:peptidoglycan/LPS O-acetylase OafA/YrhL
MRSRSYATLDGLRGVAALSIVFLHCYRYVGDLTWSSAALAVDLFFVLSGFVLAYAYEAKLPTGSRAFVKARLIRLYPLYVVGTLLGMIEAVLIIYYGQSSIGWTWGEFWTALPFALLMLPTPGQMFPFNGVMWSIFFELFINLVWAAFWRPLQSTRMLIAVVILSGIGLALSVAHWGTLTSLGASWDKFVGGAFRVSYSFFLGVLLFRFHKRWPLPKIHPLILMVGLPTVLFLPLSPFLELGAALFVLPWFVLLGSQIEPRGIFEAIARKLGIASYAVYTVHKRLYLLSYAFVLQIIGIDLQLFAPWVGIVFVLLLIPTCLLLNHWVDEPARRWLTARAKRPVKVAAQREEATQAP